jgi:hypothetical protein
MIAVDWSALALGGVVGAVLGALFFVGLAVGMRYALRSGNPVTVLSLSAALRISALLGGGWIVLGQGGAWACLGYALAFFATRLITTISVRISMPAVVAQ